uniref:Cytochrome c oxidase subunit 2 n=1 Tax=Membranipora grandicella TaxID=192923 RepID=I6M196_9BILA|nr:cytochrome c oxidase subunit II [Membranipora grandicella]AEH99605.1 cytochrome c oxidase subunit II [Membranipora grandicella]
MLFQESCGYHMYLLSNFHDFSLAIILSILMFVGGLTYTVTTNSFISSQSISVVIEVVWTILPMMILIYLALPSMYCLYTLEEVNPKFSFKVLGHQWYWSYEMTSTKNFNSYMQNNPKYRLLDVDARMVLPWNSTLEALVTSADVLHCWTVPALGIKADAVPGRLNQLYMYILRPSVLYGQCSEICGANHSFMPIVVESINEKDWIKWME